MVIACVVGGYLISYLVAFVVIGRLRARQLMKEHGTYGLNRWQKKDDVLPTAMFGALVWPLVLPGMVAWRFITKELPEPDPIKPEGKKDWVEGYDTPTPPPVEEWF